jgi:hypothetical protein
VLTLSGREDRDDIRPQPLRLVLAHPLCQIDLRMAELGFQVIGEQEISIIRRIEM